MKHYTSTTEYNCGIDLHAYEWGVLEAARKPTTRTCQWRSAAIPAPRHRLRKYFPQGNRRAPCFANSVVHSAAATFNRGMQRTREELLEISRPSPRPTPAVFSLPPSLHSFISSASFGAS